MFNKVKRRAQRYYEEEVNEGNNEIRLSSHDRNFDYLSRLVSEAHSGLLTPIIFNQSKAPSAEGYTGSEA